MEVEDSLVAFANFGLVLMIKACYMIDIEEKQLSWL